jgi:hypothetical protein
MLRNKGRIADGLIKNLMGSSHSGFSVHNAGRVAMDDREAQERVAQCIIRNTFSVADTITNGFIYWLLASDEKWSKARIATDAAKRDCFQERIPPMARKPSDGWDCVLSFNRYQTTIKGTAKLDWIPVYLSGAYLLTNSFSLS